MDNGISDRLTSSLNKAMVLYMKHNITYKGTYRGIGKKRQLVFDLTEKLTMVGIKNCRASYERQVMHCTEYINPEDLLNFEVDKNTTCNNGPNNHVYRQLCYQCAPSSSTGSSEENAEVSGSSSGSSQDEVPNLSPAYAEDQPSPAPPSNYITPSWFYQLINFNGQVIFVPRLYRQNMPSVYYPPAQPLLPITANIQPIPVETPNLVHQQSEIPIQVNNEASTSLNHQQPIHVNNEAPDVLDPQLHCEQPVDFNNQAPSSIEHQLDCEEPANINDQELQNQACGLSEPESVKIDYQESCNQIPSFPNQEVSEDLLTNQAFPEMRSQHRYEHEYNYSFERSTNLLKQVPYDLLSQPTNSNCGQKLDVTTTILHSYSITQLMAGVVPGAENVLQPHVPNSQKQFEKELNFEYAVDFPIKFRPKQKPSINKDRKPFETLKIGNAQDKIQLGNKIPKVIESKKKHGISLAKYSDVCKADYVSVPYALLSEDSVDIAEDFDRTGAFNIPTESDVEPKYTILKRDKNNPVLQKILTSGDKIASRLSEKTDMDKMSPEEFEIHQMKSLGEELMSLLNGL